MKQDILNEFDNALFPSKEEEDTIEHFDMTYSGAKEWLSLALDRIEQETREKCKEEVMKDCCMKSVFNETAIRISRCTYKCGWCSGDVSVLWAFYSLSLEESKEVEKKKQAKAYKAIKEKLNK